MVAPWATPAGRRTGWGAVQSSLATALRRVEVSGLFFPWTVFSLFLAASSSTCCVLFRHSECAPRNDTRRHHRCWDPPSHMCAVSMNVDSTRGGWFFSPHLAGEILRFLGLPMPRLASAPSRPLLRLYHPLFLSSQPPVAVHRLPIFHVRLRRRAGLGLIRVGRWDSNDVRTRGRGGFDERGVLGDAEFWRWGRNERLCVLEIGQSVGLALSGGRVWRTWALPTAVACRPRNC
ncbi:hypothetical protein B0H19DRAFT_11652 [Mycena capillaripes]|nr:hypothetical protein B0H19DRAFT_11652 [Mycena capillaripes]